MLDDKENFEEIAIRVANIFHKSDELVGKQKALYIWGESDTGKSTLIARPIIEFFGKANVGYFNSSNTFKFENLIGKNVAVLDEFSISKNNTTLLQELKKLLNEEELLADRKYQQATLLEKMPVVIISNYNLNHLNLEDSKALQNRIKKIQFLKNETVKLFRIKKIRDNEEAAIIIKCNNIYFKRLKKTRMTPKQILNAILSNTTDVGKNKKRLLGNTTTKKINE